MNPWNELDDALVETVLARFPTIEILRCQFVCKRWRSIIHSSPTFSFTSKQHFGQRGPWFFMFNSYRSVSTCVIYDMEVSDWRRLHLQVPTTLTTIEVNVRTRPVASSGGLICFDRTCGTEYYSCIVNNPLTGWVSPSIPSVKAEWFHRGIAMHASKSRSGLWDYKIFVVYGDWTDLVLKVFTPSTSEEDDHHHKANNWKVLPASDVTIWPTDESGPIDWILTRGQEIGVTTLGNEGQILVHYLIRSRGRCQNRLICFDIVKGTFIVSPRLSHYRAEINLVECGGRVFCVDLGGLRDDIDDYPVLRVWEFDYDNAVNCWNCITVNSLKWWDGSYNGALIRKLHKDYDGLEPQMNCSGHGDFIMVCLNFYDLIAIGRFNHVLMYNIKENAWTELPPCFDPDDSQRIWFASPYSFEPEMGAKV